MNNLKIDIEEQNMFDKAEQQITGFIHREKGFDLQSLVISMGLTLKEWERMKKEAAWYEELSRFDVEMIDDAVCSKKDNLKQ